MELFAANGQFFRNGTELFGLTSWVQVMLGQGITHGPIIPRSIGSRTRTLLALVNHVEKSSRRTCR